MAKDEKQQRIENTIANVGLGNADPERIAQIVEDYERAMSDADFSSHNTGKKFKDVLADAEKKGEESK